MKCDERRPACERCTSTGRTCDGYGIWNTVGGKGYSSYSHGVRQRPGIRGPLPQTTDTQVTNRPTRNVTRIDQDTRLLVNLKVDSDELICLEFFQFRSLFKLPGFFDTGFWEQIVPRLSAKEPAVMHAVVALASTQRSQEYISCMRTNPEDPFFDYDFEVAKWDRFALQQYNKAITHLKSHFEDNSHQAVQIALTTCILFICIELMRGSYSIANVHINHGINVLRVFQQRHISSASTKGPGRTIYRTSDTKTIDEHLLEILARMNTQCGLFGYPSRYFHATMNENLPTDRIPYAFLSLEECRQYMEVLLNRVIRLVKKSIIGSLVDSISGSGVPVLDTREGLQAMFEAWKMSMDRTVANLPPWSDHRLYIALIILRVYSIMIEIMIGTCPNPNEAWDELAFDEYTSLFSKLLNTAGDLVMMHRYPGKFVPEETSCHVGPLNFSADIGLVPPLYYTAIKCRVPSVRRKAIQSLYIAPHREAVWDGTAVAGAAETIVRLEEGDFYKSHQYDENSSPSSSISSIYSPGDQQDTLPASQRFQDVHIIMEDGLAPKGKVVCRKRRDRVFDASPLEDGTSPEWETIEKWFKCGERLSTYTWSNIQTRYRESGLTVPSCC